MKKIITVTGLVLGMLALPAQADGVATLKDFFKNTQTLWARFNQVVTDTNGGKLQEVKGSMQLQRPGKFRWDYDKPFVQQIIGDGAKVWLYDPELNQVTVRSLDKAMGSSPAALLAGGNEIEKNFNLKNLSNTPSLEWVSASPKDKDSGFESVALGFLTGGPNKGMLQELELLDSFGNKTKIKLSQWERNSKIDAQQFKFVPPIGADVVGE